MLLIQNAHRLKKGHPKVNIHQTRSNLQTNQKSGNNANQHESLLQEPCCTWKNNHPETCSLNLYHLLPPQTLPSRYCHLPRSFAGHFSAWRGKVPEINLMNMTMLTQKLCLLSVKTHQQFLSVINKQQQDITINNIIVFEPLERSISCYQHLE